MLDRLRCSAAGDEDGVIFGERPRRPKQVIISAASLPVLPELTIFFETIDRWRIRIAIVELPDFLGNFKRRRELLCSLAHSKKPCVGPGFTPKIEVIAS